MSGACSARQHAHLPVSRAQLDAFSNMSDDAEGLRIEFAKGIVPQLQQNATRPLLCIWQVSPVIHICEPAKHLNQHLLRQIIDLHCAALSGGRCGGPNHTTVDSHLAKTQVSQ